MAQDINTTDATPTKSDVRRMRSAAKSSDDLLGEVYEQGRREGSSSRGGTRRRAPRPSPRARRALTSGARDPAGVASGIQLLGLTLVVVALYTVLVNSDHLAGVLGGIGRALRWLSDPTASIPYTRHPDR